MPRAHSSQHIPSHTAEQSNAEVLLWQSRLRVGFALFVMSIGVALLIEGAALPLFGIVTVFCYIALHVALSVGVRRTAVAKEWMVATSVMADVLFVFGITYLVVPPEYYDRALLLGFAILHLTEFYYGRSLAWSALAALMLGYVAMILKAKDDGAPLLWSQELWSLTVFALTAGSFILHYGNFKWRLARLVSLFERAEEGDFSGEYDLSADTHPDGITHVGRAYNRVRSQLANLVLTDALSGCLNRRGLEQQLSREISRAARSGQELALIALDVDYFKQINDTFGHLAGDAVIQEVGELLRTVARTGDVVARTGGDEFMLLLPNTNAAGAFRVATRIREEVRKQRFQGVSGRVPVTVSIGLVSDRVPDENIIQDLHSRADEALYAAKDGGRDRVSIWTPNLRAIAVTRAGQQLLAASR
ncbi:MAG TPA: GGDEF domain-containing protein [Gemmatimonadaceae bacterium]|nr:GGDEF domain-containing protein [Gemmatimonadaceae bacterium]